MTTFNVRRNLKRAYIKQKSEACFEIFNEQKTRGFNTPEYMSA